ncbi:MAG: ABC transporter ATP-binding protein [Phycisphaerales bacterium]|nr:ABC transporter ATP-binding protein [Phycisphaerales bacterium]
MARETRIGSGLADGNLVVEAAGLTKVFTDFWMRAKARAVDNVDFEIRPNEIFGLLGPNGSGKSTTIKMILGLLHKTKGRLSVFGKDPSDVSIKTRIGYLPEESYLYRYLDASETLDYYGRIFGLDRRSRKSRNDELLEMVGLSQVRRRPVGEYSKGMMRRLGLAQALINDPDFLILDEPTSGLDPIGTKQVKDLLVELGKRGKTILLSSHLLADVEDVCDRMVILYGGRIRAEGTTGELLADSDHTVIRTSRLSSKTINRVEEVLRAEGTAIDAVESPRQKLEDLFMGIVEQAMEEQVATAGAVHGGETAAFLQEGEDESIGEGLIESLQRDEDTPVRAVEQKAEQAVSNGESVERDKVLDDLLHEHEEEKPEVPGTEVPDAPSDVDTSLIEGLVDDTDKKKDSES